MKIDSHHHLWQYNPQDYPWINETMDVLKQDYLSAQLQNEIKPLGINGTIAVQARQSLEETQWLLQLAEQHSFIKGIVGWVPLINPNVKEDLHRLSSLPSLKGVRHVLHDEPDDGYMLRDDFNRGISCLLNYNLVYDILIFAKHLPNTIQFVDKHPNQTFVIDHIAKPIISSDRFDHDWMKNIQEIAKRKHVYCKVSGIVTEVRDAQWTLDLIQPYMDTVIDAFGAKRLMFGTDWPVCLLRTDYAEWFQTVQQWMKELSPDEQENIMGNTACRVYGLQD